MVKIYKQPFAHNGDTIAIPDASQPDGKMSSADGWTPDYQLPKTDPNYKPVGRQEMNGVFKEVTEALGQVQVQGAASWSAEGAPYPINAQVYHNGKQWLALRPNSVEPAEGEDWSAIGTTGVVPEILDADITVTVSGTLAGDFDKLSEALEFLSKRYAVYVNKGFTAKIKLLSGFFLDESIDIRNVDLSFITIASESSVVQIAANLEIVNNGAAFIVNRAVSPLITNKFSFETNKSFFNNTGTRGLIVTNGARCFFKGSEVGFIHADTDGIFANRGSIIVSENGLQAEYCGENGILASEGSKIIAPYSYASYCEHGIHASASSIISAHGSVVKYCGATGIRALHGSFILATGTDASLSYEYGVLAYQGSGIVINDGNTSSAGHSGFVAERSSCISANGSKANYCTEYGYKAEYGSIIEAINGSARSSGRGFVAIDSGKIVAMHSTVTGVTYNNGYMVENGSNLNAIGGSEENLSQTKNLQTRNGIIYY